MRRIGQSFHGIARQIRKLLADGSDAIDEVIAALGTDLKRDDEGFIVGAVVVHDDVRGIDAAPPAG